MNHVNPPYLLSVLLIHSDAYRMGEFLMLLKGIDWMESGIVSKNKQGHLRKSFSKPPLSFIPACRFEWDGRFLSKMIFKKVILELSEQTQSNFTSILIINPQIQLILPHPWKELIQSQVAFLPKTNLPISEHIEKPYFRSLFLPYLKND